VSSDLEGDSSWLVEANIHPEIWQEQNGRWAAPQHYTCTYMAMFPPQLPHYFISRFTEPGDIVLDPFSGRGTTPVQAMSQSRFGIGNDLNDLAYVLTRGKIANPSPEEVLSRLDELERGFSRKDWLRVKGIPLKIRMIFHPETQRHLMYLRRELKWKENDVDAFLTMVLMGAMHGASPGFLSLPMPNTFSMGWGYVKKYIKKHNLKRPNRDAFVVLRGRCERFLRLGPLPGKGLAIHGDVRNLDDTGEIVPGSVKMIFSSPPYLKVIKYGLYNWIRLWWLLGDYREVDEKLDDAHAIGPYLEFMRDVMETTLPLMNPINGLACWVIGDVNGKNLADEVWRSVGSKIEVKDCNGELSRYRLLGIIEDKIQDVEKVTRIWNSEVDKSGKATPTDRILIICHENSNPIAMLSNEKIVWSPMMS
jgi:site-specific DNA-methyltransferase (adenine-specific)